MSFPAATSFAAAVIVPDSADGTAGRNQGLINSNLDEVVGIANESAADQNAAAIDGSAIFDGSGTMHVLFAAEVVTNSGVYVKAGACGILWTMNA